MTNGVKELDMPKEFKSVAEQLKAMYNALKKWPFMMGITILMFVLLISSEYLTIVVQLSRQKSKLFIMN